MAGLPLVLPVACPYGHSGALGPLAGMLSCWGLVRGAEEKLAFSV